MGVPAPMESCHGDFFPRRADHTWRFADISTMNRRWIEMRHALVVFALFAVEALASPCGAQAPSLPPVESQAVQTPQAEPSAGVSGQAYIGTTLMPIPGVGSSRRSSVGKRFGSAGHGLPGMPGGPPIKGSMGYQDPSGRYMRPLEMPPVLCDPAINIPC